MRLPKITVNSPVTTIMVFLAIMLFGIVSYFMLPKDMLPDIELPAITVVTIYPGASAEEVEQQISNPLETILSGTANLKRIQSQSKENMSFISLEFDWGTDITEATNNARDNMELVKSDLPTDAQSPFIMKVNSAMIPVVVYAIRAEESYSGLEKIVQDQIINQLKKVDGVGSAFMIGQPTREIKIHVNPQKLKAYNISIQQISTILQAENLTIPGGNIKQEKHDFSVRIPGKIESLDELSEIAITNFNGQIIRLKDIADLKDGFKDKDEFVYSLKNPGVGLFIQKQTGTNTLEVFNAIDAKMQEISQRLPPDVKYDRVFDTVEVITETTRNLSNTIYYAALFVMLVVLAFLRNWKNSLIVILSIPFSLIAAYITMFVMDYTINIFSLMSLIVAIGMVVDNTIVVLENIIRHNEMGSPAKQSAIFGTAEMGKAITASTLTTVSVFFPLIFMEGLVGILFKQLAVLVAVTMLASLFTALSLTPMLSSILLKKTSDAKQKHSWVYRFFESIFIQMESIYYSSLKFALKYQFLVILFSVLLLGWAALIATRQGSDYIPEMDAGDVITVIETQVGTSAKETKRIAQLVEDIYIEEVPEMVSQYTLVGQTESNLLTSIGFAEGKNRATISAHLTLPNERERSAEEIAQAIREKVKNIPEIVNYQVLGGSMLQNVLFGKAQPIEFKLYGSNYDVINASAESLADKLREYDEFSDIETSIDKGKLDFQIHIDKEKASKLGLNTAMIAMQVRQSIYGASAGDFTENNEDIEINIRYSPEYLDDISKLKHIYLTTLTGQQVPLTAVADINVGMGPLDIIHESQQRMVKVGANLNGVSLGEGAIIAKQIVKEMEFDPEISVKLGGKISEKDESFANLNLIFIIAFSLVYMIMASQFESFKAPFIIIFAIPFSLIGVIFAFALTGVTLSIVSFLGIIMLLGIVVNNGIVLVDYTNLLRARGDTVKSAILNSGKSRLRPVLMTSFTTILAMIPMSISKSMGNEIWVPLGITMIGGLLVSMLITLIIIPVLYAIFYRKQVKLEAKTR
jgi:hydrophobe/amphiphile efflux-1 (HAE1) family protein